MKTIQAFVLVAAVTLVAAPISPAQPTQTWPAAHVHGPSAEETNASVPDPQKAPTAASERSSTRCSTAS